MKKEFFVVKFKVMPSHVKEAYFNMCGGDAYSGNYAIFHFGKKVKVKDNVLESWLIEQGASRKDDVLILEAS